MNEPWRWSGARDRSSLKDIEKPGTSASSSPGTTCHMARPGKRWPEDMPKSHMRDPVGMSVRACRSVTISSAGREIETPYSPTTDSLSPTTRLTV